MDNNPSFWSYVVLLLMVTLAVVLGRAAEAAILAMVARWDQQEADPDPMRGLEELA